MDPRILPDNPGSTPNAPTLQLGCTLPGGLLGTVNDEEGTLKEDPASGAVAGTATVALVGADPYRRDLNADVLRHAGYSVVDLATCEQLVALLAGGSAVDCLVVSEDLKPPNARELVSEIRSLCPELRSIVWELDRSDGVDQICEAVEWLLVDAGPCGDAAKRTATDAPGGADRRRRVDS